MARIRSIKPDFCTSPSTSRVSRDARLLFLLMLTDADDEGRLFGSLKRLAGCLYPDDDDVTPAKVRKWLAELEREQMVMLYRVDDADYVWIVNFTKHQKISHPSPSRLPKPPEDFRNDSGTPPESFPPDLGSGSRNREGDAEPASAGSLDFEPFWTAYPPRDGKKIGKAKAEERWRRMTDAERQAAIVGAGHLAQAISAGGKFGPPDAERWLRDRRWADWQEPARNGSANFEPQRVIYR